MADMIKFYRGLVNNLPTTGENGALYITTDEGAIYYGTGTSMKRLGDFVQVANVEALPEKAHESCLYYCVAENILAKWNGEEWKQINKQPTAAELKTLLGLGSAAYTDADAYDAAGAAADVREYVGDIPVGEDGNPVAASVIGYINKKTDGIATSGNLEALGARVTTAEGEIDALQGDVAAINNAETGVLAQAKAYVDEEDKFVTDILTVDKFGGIDAGSDLSGMTTHEILNALLYPYIAFTINSSSRNAAAATLENGATQTLNSATISVTKKSKPITSIKLLNGSTVLEEKTGDDVAAGGTITFSDLGITVTKDNNPNLKFTVTDGTTSTDKNVGASTFVYPYYMGECAADATIDETLIEGLTKKVESKGNKTVTHSCENGRMVIAYPKAHGVLKSILDPNNFETIGDYTRSEVSVTGLDGTEQVYYVYASGAATVSGFKVQYKY